MSPLPAISEIERRNYAGWEGLFVHCRASGGKDARLAEICAQAAKDVQKLASSARLRVEILDDPAKAAVAAAVSSYMMLRIDLTSTETEGGTPVALFAHVRAYSFFMGAVDMRAIPHGERPNPRQSERTGEVVFWERRLVGVCEGSPDALQAKFSEALATYLGAFLDHFAAAQADLIEPAPPPRPTF